jgi:hypothetical protein
MSGTNATQITPKMQSITFARSSKGGKTAGMRAGEALLEWSNRILHQPIAPDRKIAM